MSVAVIINPVSGTGGGPEAGRRRAELAARVLVARGFEPVVYLTERSGHARELAQVAVNHGARTVVAWGGDGTVNEVASALVFSDARLAIVPSGSGNGLARELLVPFDPARALGVAIGPHEHAMDAGELDGHLFFNVAGIGLDARVAHRFAEQGLVGRGFSRYLAITLREIVRYEPDEYIIVADDERLRSRPLLIAIANARQYGNGALIAPQARLDDGRLDVVVVAYRSPIRALVQAPRVFLGQVGRVSGVTMRTAAEVEIRSARPVVYHLDGEPHVGGTTISAKVHPRALRVMVPGPR
ncbi:MAG: diacylglycerol kinase family protein [Vicinamibacterales bacterium]